jgi:hypothetical protein
MAEKTNTGIGFFGEPLSVFVRGGGLEEEDSMKAVNSRADDVQNGNVLT